LGVGCNNYRGSVSRTDRRSLCPVSSLAKQDTAITNSGPGALRAVHQYLPVAVRSMQAKSSAPCQIKAQQWWYFLTIKVPPDNNLAERALRLAAAQG